MKSILLVGLGGFLGSILRFGVGAYILHGFPQARFPWATLIVNVLGCFAVGFIAAAIERTNFYNAELRLMLITGFLGGFTTFSAFGLETLYLFKQDLFIQAILNVVISITLGLCAVYLGLRAAH